MKTQRLAVVLTVINLLLLAFLLTQVQRAAVTGGADVLRARALEIVDDRGQVRARINVEPAVTMPDGTTYPEEVIFRMADPSGLIRVKLGANQDGSGLMLADDSQQPGVHLMAKGSGTFLKLISQDGQEQIITP